MPSHKKVAPLEQGSAGAAVVVAPPPGEVTGWEMAPTVNVSKKVAFLLASPSNPTPFWYFDTGVGQYSTMGTLPMR